MLCLLHHFYIYVISCAYSYMEYMRNQEKLIKPKKTRKNPIKPKKKPNPYPIKGQTGIGFFWVTPPPPSQIFKYFGECSQFHKIINKARKVARHLVLHSFKYSCRDVTSFLFSNSLMILEISSLLQEHATTYSITQIISKTSIGIH